MKMFHVKMFHVKQQRTAIKTFHVKHAADSGLKMFHVKRVGIGRQKMFHVKQSETADICVSRETKKTEEPVIGDMKNC
jgi:hypothetical protein